MIQELISTSSPKCLDGNAGFGIVAQTEGMPPNVAKDVAMLSGYSHLFPAGDPKNPMAFLHVIRRSGGQDRHIISRIADCGNDYSGRTNRIGHHLIVEETDVYNAIAAQSCPAVIAQRERFIEVWNQPSDTLPRGKELSRVPVSAGICRNWQQRYNDAGWGGVVAETIEKGDPVSILYEPGTDVLSLLAEAFALLPSAARWKTTFSTFFMKSQEPPNAPKIQVKCIVVGGDEMAFAKLTPNTLLIDLRQPPPETPTGKYVEAARTGKVAQPAAPLPPPKKTAAPEQGPTVSVPRGHVDGDICGTQDGLPDGLFDGLLDGYSMSVPTATRSKPPRRRTKQKSVVPWIVAFSIIGLLVVTASLVVFKVVSDTNRAAILAVEEARKMATKAEKAVDEATQMVGDANAAVGEAERKAKEAKAAAEVAKNKAEEAKNAANVADAEAALEEAKNAANKTKTAADAASEKAKEATAAAGKASEKANDAITAAQEANEKTGKAKTLDADGMRSKATAAATAAEKEKQKAEEAKDAAQEAKKLAEEATTTAEDARNEAQAAVADVRQKEQAAAMSAVEKKTQDEESEKNKIKDQLGKLPDVLLDIALPPDKMDEPVPLADSQFLWDNKDRVKINIVPYVDLGKTSEIGVFGIEPKYVQETEKQEIDFLLVDSGEANPEKQKPSIIKFSLTKNGLSYEWNQATLQQYSPSSFDTKSFWLMNRILLSKLQINVEDHDPKEIALWTPTMLSFFEFQQIFPKNHFTLWKDKKGQFVLDTQKENVSILLDFDEIHYEKSETIKSKEFVECCRCYAPKLPMENLDGGYGIVVLDGDLSMKLGVFSKAAEKILDDINTLSNQIDNLSKRIRGLSTPVQEICRELLEIVSPKDNNLKQRLKVGNIEKEVADNHLRKKDFKDLAALQKCVIDRNSTLDQINIRLSLPAPLTQAEQQKFGIPDTPNDRNNLSIKTTDEKNKIKELHDKLTQSCKDLTTPIQEKNNFEKQREDKQKELGEENEKWKDIHAKYFSIALLKPGTKPMENDESNRLLLFRVTKN